MSLLLPTCIRPTKTLLSALKKAQSTLEQFNEVLEGHAAHRQLFTLLLVKEAVASLASQHIRTSAHEVFFAQAFPDEDLQPILRYFNALARIAKTDLSHALIAGIHKSVKKNKGDHGIYRKKQNWIGPEGGTIDEAYYFPPAPSKVRALMGNLIRYWKKKEKDPLIQLAVLFAQLLIIHPFMDGNGRVARILVPQFLYQKGLIELPILFLSRYLKTNRLAYFQNLFNITSNDRWDRWICFFLKGIEKQGSLNLKEAKKIIALYESLQLKLSAYWPAKKRDQILLFLFKHPICTQEMCLRNFSRSKNRALLILDTLIKNKVLRRQSKSGKAHFVFTALLK